MRLVKQLVIFPTFPPFCHSRVGGNPALTYERSSHIQNLYLRRGRPPLAAWSRVIAGWDQNIRSLLVILKMDSSLRWKGRRQGGPPFMVSWAADALVCPSWPMTTFVSWAAAERVPSCPIFALNKIITLTIFCGRQTPSSAP